MYYTTFHKKIIADLKISAIFILQTISNIITYSIDNFVNK